jgi:hypothetical protein
MNLFRHDAQTPPTPPQFKPDPLPEFAQKYVRAHEGRFCQAVTGWRVSEIDFRALCEAVISGLEGMIAAQLLACHNASMECYRRDKIGEQTFEGRRENLS